MAEFSNISGSGGSLPRVRADLSAVPGALIGVARTVAGIGGSPPIAELEANLALALEALGGPGGGVDQQDASLRSAKRKLGIVFVGALEKLCAQRTYGASSTERRPRARRNPPKNARTSVPGGQ